MAPHDDGSIARRGEQMQNIAVVFLALSWFIIALRIWTRTFVISNFGWDDATMILSGLIFTVYCASVLYIEAHGGGTHVTSYSQLVDLTKWSISAEVTYVATVMVLKISLGIFFARIVVNEWQRILIYVAVAGSAVSSVASFFYCLFRCGPNLNDYVLRQISNKCTPRPLDRFFAYQHASFATLTDFIFAALPIFILWGTNMDRRSKMSVGAILSLAALGCICSVIRFQYVDGLTQIEDFFWNAVNVSIWSTIELGAGIIAACLATLRPFLRRAVIKARSMRSSASRSIKQVSRSTRSNNNSSKQKSVTGSTSDHRPRRDTQAQLEAHYGELIELRCDSSKKGGSTDCILPQPNDAPEPWPTRQGGSLELDRTSTRTMRSRAYSDPLHHSGQPPPVPTAMRDQPFESQNPPV